MFGASLFTRLSSNLGSTSGTRVFLCLSPHLLFVHHDRCSVEIEDEDEDLLPEVVLGNFLWLDDTQNDTRYEARVTHINVFPRGVNRIAVV